MKDNFGEWLHPICPLLIKYKEVQKLLNAYTKSLYSKVVEEKIYGDLLSHGTESGRMSAREPNLQQLPKNDTYKVRGLFTASPGYKMMVADFSQEELRVAGVLTNAPVFYDAYNTGKDLHLKTANDCFNLGIPEECLVKKNPQYKTYEDKFHKDRFNAKSINFGLLYGRTAHGLAPQLGCTVEEAQEIVNNYFKAFPEVKVAMENTNREIKVRGYVDNMYGRRRRFSKMVKGNKTFYPPAALREGFNHKIQGACADILRVVMIELYKYVKEVGNEEIRILTTVHDEIMFEIKDNENFDNHVKKLIYIMENAVKLPIKLEAEFEVGSNYGECK
jgi:DNA polymerase-1